MRKRHGSSDNTSWALVLMGSAEAAENALTARPLVYEYTATDESGTQQHSKRELTVNRFDLNLAKNSTGAMTHIIKQLGREEWFNTVAQPALKLDGTMRLLSKNWGRAFGGWALFWWTLSFHFFVDGMNLELAAGMDARLEWWISWRAVCFTFSALLLPVPLLQVYDVAQTSTSCDELMEALNATRIAFGVSSQAKSSSSLRLT